MEENEKYQIEIKVTFRAGHRLLPPYKGSCNNPHGEGYTAIFIFEKENLDENGMVFDFGSIKGRIKKWINENWDHSYIHHYKDEVGQYLKSKGFRTYVLPFNPTAEHMAGWLFKEFKHLSLKKVGIIESFEDSIAWFGTK